MLIYCYFGDLLRRRLVGTDETLVEKVKAQRDGLNWLLTQ